MSGSPDFLRSLYPYVEVPRLILKPGRSHPIWVTDTTFRDGQQGVGPFTKEHIVALYGFLNRLGGPNGVIRKSELFVQLKEDRRAIEACLGLSLPYPKPIGWVRVKEEDLILANRLGLSEVGMLMSVSDHHIYKKLAHDRLSIQKVYRRGLERALEMGFEVSVHLEDITRSDVYGFVVPLLQELRGVSDSTGRPLGVRLCDTLGLGVPIERVPAPRGVPALVQTVLSEVGLNTEQLEWHGHDDFHLAQANALAAWVNGCSGVNGTLFGIGERAGNTPLDALVLAYIALEGKDQGVDLCALKEAAVYFEETMGIRLPERYPIFGKEALTTKAGIHAYGMMNDEESYSAFDVEGLLGINPRVAISKTSGVSGLAQWINAYFGLESENRLTKANQDLRLLYRAIQENYGQGREKDYGDEEILELIETLTPSLFQRLLGQRCQGGTTV